MNLDGVARKKFKISSPCLSPYLPLPAGRQGERIEVSANNGLIFFEIWNIKIRREIEETIHVH